MTKETFNGTWLEATMRRTFYLHMLDMPPVELQGSISLPDLISRINQLEKSGPPVQALPLLPDKPWWERGEPFRDKYPAIPGKHSWGRTEAGKTKPEEESTE